MNNYYEEVNKQIAKEYTDGIILTGDQIIDDDSKILSVSPAVDWILGGGIKEGTFATFSGPTRCGKSVTALHFAGKCQKLGKHVYYLDIEGKNRKNRKLLDGIKTLNSRDPAVFTMYSSEGWDKKSEDRKLLLGKDFLNIAEKALKTDPEGIVILDSISTLSEEKIFNDGPDSGSMGSMQKMQANFCRNMCQIVSGSKSIVISIVHLMANISKFGSGKPLENVGTKVKYMADTRIRSDYFKVITDNNDKIKDGVGQEVSWTQQAANNAPPGRECVSYIRYGIGIDEVRELIYMCEMFDIVKKSGGWYSFGDQKFHGIEELTEVVSQNDKWKSYLLTEYRKRAFAE